MKKKRGFTLVELLAVIVILAVILIIAMPKISDVIKNSKEASLETTAKLIASQAEKKYTENQVLDNSSTIKCSDVVKLNENDYGPCNITFDDKGNAKVSIVGKGKFEGMAVCNANKNSASISSDCATDASYFTYEDVETVKTSSISHKDVEKCKSYAISSGGTEEDATTMCTTLEGLAYLKNFILDGIIPNDYETTGLKVEYIIVENVEVKDENKCKSYIQADGGSEADATTLCTTEDGLTQLNYAVKEGYIPSSDYEIAGLNVTHKPYVPSITITGYNIEGGTDVVIPSQIDGKTVVAIGYNAFTTYGVIPTLTAYNNDYKVSLLSYNSNNNYVVKPLTSLAGLGITSVIIPNTVTSIGSYAFKGNKLTNVTIPSSVTLIAASAFEDNKLTNVEIPSSITEIGDYAFANNLNIVITNNSSIENTVDVWKNIFGVSPCTGDVAVEGNVITYIYNEKPC